MGLPMIVANLRSGARVSIRPFPGNLACTSDRFQWSAGSGQCLEEARSVSARGGAMVLLRKVIGDALRARRLAQHRTLREVSTAANVSLGYLSEIERGHKEASSELLASICDALGAPLSQMLGDVSATFALAEQMEEAFSPE